MRRPKDDGPDAALARLTALRAEHKPIMDAIVGDPGMAPATRTLLIAHLLEEEDEHLAAISAAGSARASIEASRSSQPTQTGTRIVSRRDDQRASGAAGLTVGSLRRPSTTRYAWRKDR